MGLLSALAVIAAFIVQGVVDLGWVALSNMHVMGWLLFVCAILVAIDILFVRGGWAPLAPRQRAAVGERPSGS
jgi:hypothetical protein